ncbi:MAG: bacteriophage holin [Rhodospirillales bacterium]
MKLNVRAFAIAFGLWWGIGVFFLAWWVNLVGGAPSGGTLLELIYIGFAYTPVGSVIGLAWGFVDGLIGGAILAWLYNLLAARFSSAAGQQAPGGG